jgi:hypothetical protein
VEKYYLTLDIKLLSNAVVIVSLLPYPTAKLSVLKQLCKKGVNIGHGTKYITAEDNNLNVMWTLVECTVKRCVEQRTYQRTLNVLLMMYVRCIKICAVQQLQQKLSCGKLFTTAGSESCTKTEGHPLVTHGSAAFETKRTVSKNYKMFSGSKLA